MSSTLNCEPCGKVFTGLVSYQQHLESVKHQRKVSSLSIIKGSNNLELQTASQISSPAQLNNVFECSVCGLVFDSSRNFVTHSISLAHVQKVLEKNSENLASNIVTSSSDHEGNNCNKNTAVDHEDNGYDKNIAVDHEGNGYDKNIAVSCIDNGSGKNLAVDESDSILPAAHTFKSQIFSFSSCTTCKKHFSGPEPYKQHMESAAHKRKVELNAFCNETNEFSCKLCDKMFSGQIPYIQHMESETHRKKRLNVQNLKKFENDHVEGTHVLKEDSIPQVLFCKVCSVPCSGLANYNQHLEGLPHLKKVRAQTVINSVLPETSSQLGLTPCSNEEGKLQKEFSSEKNNLHTTNGNLQSIDDDLIPKLMDKTKNMYSENLESVEIFLPDESIDFDRSNDKTSSKAAIEIIPDVSNQTETNEKSNPKQECEENSVSSISHQCDICDVRLLNKEELINHYESMEHFRRKWKN